MSSESRVTRGAVETVIVPPARDLGGGFRVLRALPGAQRRTVGPFVFLDQMGPVHFGAGTGLDVRPHPHIGLATLTYLFEGTLLHRDSLGTVQVIRPGEAGWMIAGRGIVHSERTPLEARSSTSALFGLQAWLGLPRADEELAPSFSHHGTADLPLLSGPGWRLRLIAGSLLGARAPMATLSDLFYADVEFESGGELVLPAEHAERAMLVCAGSLEADGQEFEPGRLVVFRRGQSASLRAHASARALLLGGAPLDGPRHVWWNFVSSSAQRLRSAATDWREGRFATVPGETEFIPLPEDSALPSESLAPRAGTEAPDSRAVRGS